MILIGLQASDPENALALQNFLDIFPVPIVGTYQSAGAIAHRHFPTLCRTNWLYLIISQGMNYWHTLI